ncbi:unnamed protein product [Hymenolepis diminuta]|uniref:BTB domain-containing protein n=1 Tax=Hymenolepis diminuta TaxID=6216 RepID=A0A564YN52_HYMDI|nr:unnamed protein product [Hymenolepis diminuta]
MSHRKIPITLQSSCAFQVKMNLKNEELAYRNAHNCSLQNKRSLLDNLEIINPNPNSKCFSHFRGMRREPLDIFINSKEGEEVGAHLIVLSATFPVFGKYLCGNDIVQIRLSRFPHEVVNAAMEYAYEGIKYISPEVALRLYLLAHDLKNKVFIDGGGAKFLCARIEETNVSEVWSAANATKNEFLVEVCAPLVAVNWERHDKPPWMTSDGTGVGDIKSEGTN